MHTALRPASRRIIHLLPLACACVLFFGHVAQIISIKARCPAHFRCVAPFFLEYTFSFIASALTLFFVFLLSVSVAYISMVSRIFSSKSKALPLKQPVPQSDSGSSLETNYNNYTPGNNVNAHMRPMTYDSMATNSLIAQPGTGLSSSLSHSPPKMLHGYGAPAAQKPLKLHKSSEDSKGSKKRWSTQLPLTTVTGSTSYQAFDHSSSHQPLTHSVLALPSTAPAHQPKPQQKAKHNGLAAATAAVATSRVIHSSSSANTTASANKHTSTSWTHDSRGHQQPAIEHGTPPSVLESDMASAGFSGMYSKYVPKKSSMKSQGHSPPSVHPQIRSSALAHAQPPPVPQIRTHPHSYPMPQPIHMSGSSLFSHHHAERHHRPQRNHTSSHQRRSHNNPGPFSMPNLTHGSLGGYQSNVYQSQPLMAGNGSASFVLPKKHVRFAD